ncbi:MAG: hypothetical protein ABSF90_13135 [Syntrophobacteraceae bacterium]|jgi:hypothetical protein
MRNILCVFIAMAFCVISGCYFAINDDPGNWKKEAQDREPEPSFELRGAHYAKLNSIGCLTYNDLEMANAAHSRSDFDTIDNLIKEKRCLVLPTDKDILIIGHVQGDIVSAKVELEDTTRVFYTKRSNLVVK